jgi:hypothetical protein
MKASLGFVEAITVGAPDPDRSCPSAPRLIEVTVFIRCVIIGIAARATIAQSVGSRVEWIEVGVSGLGFLVKVVKVDAGDLEEEIANFPDDDLDGMGISIPTGAIPLPAFAG